MFLTRHLATSRQFPKCLLSLLMSLFSIFLQPDSSASNSQPHFPETLPNDVEKNSFTLLTAFIYRQSECLDKLITVQAVGFILGSVVSAAHRRNSRPLRSADKIKDVGSNSEANFPNDVLDWCCFIFT